LDAGPPAPPPLLEARAAALVITQRVGAHQLATTIPFAAPISR
jgi:hypothetical protein